MSITRTSEAKVVLKFIEQTIFSQIRCPKFVINTGGTY